MRRFLTLSCASFSPIALPRAFATSISLFSSLNPGKVSSRYLDELIHIFCSHSFCAESAKAPPLVNIPILPSKDLARSNSAGVGALLFINPTISATISLFPAVGLISHFLETLAKLGRTSARPC